MPVRGVAVTRLPVPSTERFSRIAPSIDPTFDFSVNWRNSRASPSSAVTVRSPSSAVIAALNFVSTSANSVPRVVDSARTSSVSASPSSPEISFNLCLISEALTVSFCAFVMPGTIPR